ncbi:sigma-70 family RNA polymerase sigma factor [Streptomyces sp. G44]|uniref:sigma-70 family RNA polymerase sigma factor n=1 Tax=Streptomyces sp. G44 TaxID=2807632 RepID=UPI0019613D26|nr:sigma-70 family RNA polymerase sigma factor [Streptomyces sp. G44]MBM7171959.1 sigma-70 family RNA polymerase sigma factor [Streptomyces sp. G44]
MSSRPETPVHATGAHRAHRDARKRAVPRPAPRTTPPARYEPCLDGLFTYCLSVLCDHDAATEALGDVLHLAERRGSRGPDAERELRAWLYALARWVCLRRLAEARRDRQGTHAARRTGPPRAAKTTARAAKATLRGARPVPRAPEPVPHGPEPVPHGPEPVPHGPKSVPHGSKPVPRTAKPVPKSVPHAPDETEQQRRHSELARLAWPEAAGTTPEQREALELAVRHQLTPAEIAAVLGMDLAKARGLLASAACEVERTRAALAVVETGSCPIVARLTADNQVLLGTALRRELVRHVDDCPRCRRTAERAGAGAWPGTAVSPATLPVVEAPRDALPKAMTHLPRARAAQPRYDRRGFPIDPKDHAARRDRLRARAVTTTVVATVVAAPVLALWAAYRGAPLTGEGHDGGAVTASDGEGPGGLGGDRVQDYENAGNARKKDGPRFGTGGRSSDVSVEVVSPGSSSGAATGPGRLTVAAQPSGDTTLITLTASGGTPVRWSASEQAPWLYLSRSSGTLAPGESVTIQVYVDRAREPSGPWSARVAIAPSGAVISIDGYGDGRPPTPPGPGPGPGPTDPRPSDPGPSDPGPSDPGPSDPGPTDPDPTPTPTDPPPTPSDPGPGDSSPPPGEGGGTPGQG